MIQTIVIDNGSHSIKGGFAGSFEPDCVFPSLIARKQYDEAHIQLVAGDDVERQVKKSQTLKTQAKRTRNDFINAKLTLSRPLLDHSDVDWEGLQRLWKYLTYDKLQLDKVNDDNININNNNVLSNNNNGIRKLSGFYENFNLLLSYHPTDTLKYKSKLIELGYETFNADGIYLAPTTTLGLYSVGKLTGTVIDSGYNNTFVSSIYEGYMLQNNISLSKIGGQTVDRCLQSLLKANPKNESIINNNNNTNRSNNSSNDGSTSDGNNNNNSLNLQICESIKKKYCYIASDFFEEEQVYNSQHNSEFNSNEYQLPDGNMVSIRNEKYQACELLFQPKIANIIGEDGLPQLVYTSISRANNNLQRQLYQNIVCIGGNTLLTGFVSRLNNGLSNFAPASVKINIKASPERKHATFTGASILASQQEQMKQVWVTKQMYEEMGSEALIVRCF